MIFGYTTILIENMVRILPKCFDLVNVIAGLSTTHEYLRMIDRMMFLMPFQGLVAPKGIGVIDQPLQGFRLDMSHELLGAYRLDDYGVDA